MIKVRMRKQDKIDPWQLMKLERGRGQSFRTNGESRQTNSDAREQHGICENFDAEKIDEHCRMTKPGECDRCIAPLFGLGFGKSWSNRPPAFNRPLTKKMTEPAPHPRTVERWSLKCFHALAHSSSETA